MKIAIINKYQGKVNRGAETFVSELSKRLSKNHEVDVFNSINFQKRYDVIIPTNGRLQVLLVRILAWLTSSKMIISGQSGIGIDDRWNLYCFPDVFIALSDYARGWAKKINPFIKVVKIPNGVDLGRFKIKDQRAKSKQKIVLAVGALTANKRHDLVIGAMSKLSDIKLIIVGDGELRSTICDLGIKVLGKERFEIIQTTNEKMPEIYQKTNLLVFPTVSWESFGIVLVEAMASGLAVVASDDPIRREIVGEAGLFVDPTDTDAFAQTIQKALDKNWGNLPHKQAEKFDWDDIAKSYEELFEAIARN